MSKGDETLMQALISPPKEKIITGHELAKMPHAERYELVAGRLHPVSPTQRKHGKVEGLIYSAIAGVVLAQDLGEVMVGEVGVYTQRDPDTVRGADVLFISHARLARLGDDAFLDVAPELVVEVLSPYDRWTDVREKIEEYFDAGVESVWIADPGRRELHIFQSPAVVTVLTASDQLENISLLPGLDIPVARLFD